LKLNKTHEQAYIEGEKILITVEASRGCYLQLVYLDASGAAYRIFPNAGSEPEGRVAGGRPVILGRGTEQEGFEFIVAPPFGGEAIYAWASEKPLPSPAGDVLEGGMLGLREKPDILDVHFHEAARDAGSQLASATALIRTVSAGDALALRDDASPAGRSEEGGFRKPRIFGLVIGVSSYSSSRIRSLRYADADARLVAEYLADPSALATPAERLRVLLNENATREAVLEAFRDFLAETGPNDLAVIYIAGHGMTSAEHNATYFLSHDTDPDNLRGTAVDQAEITSLLTERVKAGKVVFFLDACPGGGLGLTGVRLRGANTVLSSRFLTELVARKNGTVFLTASRAMEQSEEGKLWGGGHGVFTWHLVDGLRGRADRDDDGMVTIDELAEHVGERGRTETSGRQHPELKVYFDYDLVLGIRE